MRGTTWLELKTRIDKIEKEPKYGFWREAFYLTGTACFIFTAAAQILWILTHF